MQALLKRVFPALLAFALGVVVSRLEVADVMSLPSLATSTRSVVVAPEVDCAAYGGGSSSTLASSNAAGASAASGDGRSAAAEAYQRPNPPPQLPAPVEQGKEAEALARGPWPSELSCPWTFTPHEGAWVVWVPRHALFPPANGAWDAPPSVAQPSQSTVDAALDKLVATYAPVAKHYRLIFVITGLPSFSQPGHSTRNVGGDSGGKPAVVLRISHDFMGKLAAGGMQTARVMHAYATEFAASSQPGGGAEAAYLAAYNHPSAKNIGVLLATRCGANFVLDGHAATDPLLIAQLDKHSFADLQHREHKENGAFAFIPPELAHNDNPARQGNPAQLSHPDAHLAVDIMQRSDLGPVINPYSAFALRDPPPRGFPLVHAYNASHFALHRKVHPGPLLLPVQQLLTRGGPDFGVADRMRLTSANSPSFGPGRSVALAAGAYAPFNSYSTVFRSAGLWAALQLPHHSAYASDLYRSVWVSRLLWSIGGSVSYSMLGVRFYDGERFINEWARINGGPEAVWGSGEGITSALAAEAAYQTTAAAVIAAAESWGVGSNGNISSGAGSGSGVAKTFAERARSLAAALDSASVSSSAASRQAIVVDAVSAWFADLSSAGYTWPSRQPIAEVTSIEGYRSAVQTELARLRHETYRLDHTPAEKRSNIPLRIAPSWTLPYSPGGAVYRLKGADTSVLDVKDNGMIVTALPPASVSSSSVSVKDSATGLPYSHPPNASVTVPVAVCVSGLAQHLSDKEGAASSIRALEGVYGQGNVHAFWVMSSAMVTEKAYHAIPSLPYMQVTVHRDLHLAPETPLHAQTELYRWRDGYPENKRWPRVWNDINKRGGYWQMLWDMQKCWEAVASYSAEHGIAYTAVVRARTDYVSHWNASAVSNATKRGVIDGYLGRKGWDNSVLIPSGQDWSGLNDRAAIGGWRAMGCYLLRGAWVADYLRKFCTNKESCMASLYDLWAEGFLMRAMRYCEVTVLRSEDWAAFELPHEAKPPGRYLGDEEA